MPAWEASWKRDPNKMRDYMDRRVTPPKRVTSPTWGPPPPCKQVLNNLGLKNLFRRLSLFQQSWIQKGEHERSGNCFHFVRLMWSSATESTPVHNCYCQLSQAWRMAKPIQIQLNILNWFRRRTLHELKSLNLIRLMWSTVFETGL